jgi:DnaJ-class molecular chaperone
MKPETPKSFCPGCYGKGVIDVNINMGKYGCYHETQQCPICHGTKYATQEDVDKFWNTFDFPAHHEKAVAFKVKKE